MGWLHLEEKRHAALVRLGTGALVHGPLLGQPRERGSPGVQGPQGLGDAGQGGQRRAGLQNSRPLSVQD